MNSESSGTLFRSSVDTSKRFRVDHKTGMLFLLPGGTLHRTTPWRLKEEPRITVAFNLAFYEKQGFVSEELFSEAEVERRKFFVEARLKLYTLATLSVKNSQPFVI